MKKLLQILLVVAMAITLFGCGGGGGDKPSGEKSAKEKAKEAGKITVAYVVNGTLGDKSFFDSGNEGIQNINKDFGDKVSS